MVKLNTLMLSSAMLILLSNAQAQEKETFTDEELTKYATVMIWAENEKQQMGDSLESWVKNNEKLSGTAYNELSRAVKAGDINSAEVTEEEKSEFLLIQEKIEQDKNEFKEVYTTKIKEEIGVSLYNRLNKALKSDAEIKAKYEGIYKELEDSTE